MSTGHNVRLLESVKDPATGAKRKRRKLSSLRAVPSDSEATDECRCHYPSAYC
jgi:hypothetical protein